MTPLTILPIDHPILRKQSVPVRRFGPSLRLLADQMFAAMNDARGAGLAAPQVGKAIRLFIAEFADQRLVLCNPVITSWEGESLGAEGCLSLPGYVGLHIPRAERIEVEGQDLYGKPVSVAAECVFARILQHEIDHLDGILFLDHLSSPADLCRIRDDAHDETTARDAVVVTKAGH